MRVPAHLAQFHCALERPLCGAIQVPDCSNVGRYSRQTSLLIIAASTFFAIRRQIEGHSRLHHPMENDRSAARSDRAATVN